MCRLKQFVHVLASYLLGSANGLQQFRIVQQQDSTCSQFITFCKQGLPNKSQITGDVLWYWPMRGELSFHVDLLFWGHPIVIPQRVQQETLKKIHSGHQEIQQCRLHVSTFVWWPGISHQELPRMCQGQCAHVQPMIASPLPSHPWEKVASDLFQLNGKTYLLLVADYFSQFMEVQTLATTISASVFHALGRPFLADMEWQLTTVHKSSYKLFQRLHSWRWISSMYNILCITLDIEIYFIIHPLQFTKSSVIVFVTTC